ncbi:MAG: LptF/LptG family permease [Planctomycetota bacterium]|nr:LptF/LptG family permease [Planctomycetota bacterium]
MRWPSRLRPRILDLYVLRYFIVSYIICFVSFVGFFVLIDAFTHLDDYLEEKHGLIEIIQTYAVRIPEIFHRLAPYLTLAAAGFTVTRLHKNNELAPMKALGLSVFRILLPVFLAAILLSGLIVLDQEWIIPMAETARRNLDLKESREFRPRNLIPDSKGNVIAIDSYDPVLRRMIGMRVTYLEADPVHRKLFTVERASIIARQGDWDETGGGRWILRYGRVESFSTGGKFDIDPDNRSLVGAFSFGEEGFQLDTDIRPEDIESHDREIYHLTFKDLNRLYMRQRLPHLRVKLHSRLSYPAANLILLFLGLPFFLSRANRSIFISTGICAAIGFSFFFINFMFLSMGDSGTIGPMTAAWMPTIFFGCLGITLFDQVRS